MSQQQFPFFPSAGSVENTNYLNLNLNLNFNAEQQGLDVTKSSDTRRDGTKYNVDRLYQLTLIKRPGEPVITRTSGRKNKNEILGLTLARLIKEKHLNGTVYSRDIELSRDVQTRSNSSSFVMVLRTDGRIVTMSDEVEHHLGKSMRSLYTQCINIFQCLDETDGNKLKIILNSSTDLVQKDHRLVCTFRLPKGKRPSRIREDIKTISMTGHFYSCHDTSSPSYEKLFIARCEALLSRTTHSSNSSVIGHNENSDHASSMVKITLNEDMSISFVSSNVKEILGYSRSEIIGHWFGRYLSKDGLDKFEAIRQRHFQHEGQQQQAPMSICDIFDIYANNGDSRLTFLSQIRPVRERRAKTVKYQVIAQLIDPSLRSEYMKYVGSESEIHPIATRAEQVNYVPSSVSQTSQDSILANSPSLAMGLLIPDNFNSSEFARYQPYSPAHRSLSNVVAPVNVHDESWRELFDLQYTGCPTTSDFSAWSTTKLFDDAFVEYQSEGGLGDDFFDEYLTGDIYC